MKKRLPLAILFLLLGVSLFAGITQAAPPPPIEPPIIMPPIARGEVTIEYQRVNVTLENQIATTHVEQLFVNNNDWLLEGTYFFPLPAEATVSQLTMWVDGKPIEAKILQKDEARAIYDEIVRTLRDPALLEYVGQAAIQANVFPIPPHDERKIEIEYSQILPAENGVIHFQYPQSTTLYTNSPLQNQSIRVEVKSQEAIHAIYSPSHRVDVNREGDFRAVVGFEGEQVAAQQDFELYYTIAQEEIGLNLVTYRESGQDGFFVMLVAPSVEIATDKVAAKDVVVVVDSSGSMEGEKMAQAKEATQYVVDHLNPQDRFNIISFATGTRKLLPDLADVGAVDAGTFINSLEAIGGTNISQALLEAGQQGSDDRPLTIIFLTDGLATEGIVDTPLLLSTVQQNAPSSTRLFAFGVGDDVDTLLLDSLAENHRGTTTYVRPHQQIDEIVSGFFAKVSLPVLTDLEIDYDGVRVEQIYPQRLPDLFAGTQLIITGRYREGSPATITLRGKVDNEEKEFTYQDNNFRNSGGQEFIPRLWATRAVGHLLNEIRLHGENPELVQSVVNLSIRYGIITPYTSYLIEEDDIFTQSARDVIIEEVMQVEAMREVEVSGEAAVEAAASMGSMADAAVAQSALPAPMVEENAGIAPIQFVGSKTFVYQNGVWIDTAFDADQHTPQQVGFASDNFFDLLSAAPQLGQYLSLGEQVLVVFNGVAYEIVPGKGEGEVTVPKVGVEVEGGNAGISPPQPPIRNDTRTPSSNPTPLPEDVVPELNTAPYVGVFAAAILIPLAIGLFFLRKRV